MKEIGEKYAEKRIQKIKLHYELREAEKAKQQAQKPCESAPRHPEPSND